MTVVIEWAEEDDPEVVERVIQWLVALLDEEDDNDGAS